MAVIVAYGNSNTWGYDPAIGARFAPDVRWTGIMQRALGPAHKVIEEGLNGRTTVHDDPIEPHRNGLTYLTPCLLSHAPLDLVIISLGCNDLKHRFWLTPGDIALGAERLALTAKSLGVGPNGAPPRDHPRRAAAGGGADRLRRHVRGRAREIARARRALPRGRQNATASALSTPARISGARRLDGIHYEADQHAILGRAMAAAVRQRLGL